MADERSLELAKKWTETFVQFQSGATTSLDEEEATQGAVRSFTYGFESWDDSTLKGLLDAFQLTGQFARRVADAISDELDARGDFQHRG